MNKYIKQIAAAALVVTSLGGFTTTQAQADSSFNRTVLGIVAAGIVINQVKKNKARNHRAPQRQEARPYNRNRAQSNSYNNQRYHNRHNNRARYGRQPHSYGY